jgi:hypothetical protein
MDFNEDGEGGQATQPPIPDSATAA